MERKELEMVLVLDTFFKSEEAHKCVLDRFFAISLYHPPSLRFQYRLIGTGGQGYLYIGGIFARIWGGGGPYYDWYLNFDYNYPNLTPSSSII